jgi:hypothetical protein
MSLLSQTRPRETEVASPGPERKRFETSGSHDIIETMKTLMQQDAMKRDEQHKQIVTSFDELKTTVSGLQDAIKQEKTTREQEMEQLNTRMDKFESDDRQQVTQFVKMEVEKMMNNLPTTATTTHGKQHDDNDDDRDDDRRNKQVIVSGFEDGTDADVVIATIEDFLKVGSRRDKVMTVDTFTDPSSIGVISFTTIAAKIGFYKKIRDHNTQLPSGKVMTFDNNHTWEERVRNKTLGQVKYQFHKQTQYELSDIKIDRKQWVVKIKKEIVAHYEQDVLIYGDAAKLVQSEVDGFMMTWLAKRELK